MAESTQKNSSEVEYDPEMDIKVEDEFIDDGEVVDDNDPDWTEEFTSADNMIHQENESSSSEVEITGSKRKKYQTQDLSAAVKAVRNKSVTLSAAARSYNVPKSTLRKHVQNYAEEQKLNGGEHTKSDQMQLSKQVQSNLSSLVDVGTPKAARQKRAREGENDEEGNGDDIDFSRDLVCDRLNVSLEPQKKMDVRFLISAVQSRSILWNTSHPRHCDRSLIQKAWTEVGASIGIAGDAAKSKFKNLRDTFRKELKKVPVGQLWDPGIPIEEYSSGWPYFRMMFFLKDQVFGRSSSNNLSQSASRLGSQELKQQEKSLNMSSACKVEVFEFNSSAEISNLEGESTEEPSAHSTIQSIPDATTLSRPPSPQLSTPSVCPKKRKRTSKAIDYEEEYLALERKKLNLLEKTAKEEEDDCRHFLLSLLPDMKKLEESKQCLFKLKVQQLMYEIRHGYTYDI